MFVFLLFMSLVIFAFLDFINCDYLSIFSESVQVNDVEDSKSTSKQSSSQSIASEKSSSTSLK
jgi:hypothetical protein